MVTGKLDVRGAATNLPGEPDTGEPELEDFEPREENELDNNNPEGATRVQNEYRYQLAVNLNR